MKKKFMIALLLTAPFIYMACSGGNKENTTQEETTTETTETPKSMVSDADAYDPNRGVGKFDENNVTVGTLDVAMATKGKAIAEAKCFSCHKTTDEKLVGPGWKNVTTNRTPHWIMNFITNPDPMIDKDPEVKKQLELCLVRMPNQNLQEQEARDILEFMRQNDGAK